MLAALIRIFNRAPKHSPFTQSDTESLDSEILLPSSTTSLTSKSSPTNAEYRTAYKTLAICNVVYLSIGFWIVHSVRETEFVTNPDEFCNNHVNHYSPVVRDVAPRWHTQQFNGTFWHENVYRQPAGPDVDAAWEALGVRFRSIVVPESEAARSGIREGHVKISKEYGGGFPANVEGLHHVHCLDLLRKTLHWNYNYYLAKGEGPFVNSEYIVRIHTTHCLDMLRQVLMCKADVGVLGQVWWKPKGYSHPTALIGFNTKHRCRDYEGVRKWAEAHQMLPEAEVDMSRFYELRKPEYVYSAIP